MNASSGWRSAAPLRNTYPRCFTIARLLTILIVILCAIPAFPQNRRGASSSHLQKLTQEFLLQRETVRAAAAAESQVVDHRLLDLAARRQQALQSLMQQEPSAAVALALSPALLARLASEQPAATPFLESHVLATGRLEYFAVDDAAQRTHHLVRRLQLGDRKVDLHFAGAEPEGMKDGDELSVTGVLSGTHLAVVSSAITMAAVVEDSCSSKTGAQNAAVLMVTFPGVTPPATVTPQSLNDIFFAETGQSLSGFWRESSYGSTWLQGDVFGWHTLSGAYSCADLTRLRDDAIAAVAASGVDLRAYRRLFITFPDSLGCGWSGLAMLGCSTLNSPSGSFQATTTFLSAQWMSDREEAVRVASHEAGHNLGLGHAGARDFGSEVLGPLDVGGSFAEYGDPFSTMGCCDIAHYAAPHKAELLGWMAGRYATVETGGTYMVAPLESSAGTTNALKIRRGTSDAWVWAEYRQPIGAYDISLPGGAFAGVLLHYQDASSGAFSQLLDFTPTTTSWLDAALAPGKSWSDPYTNLSLALVETTSTGATLKVTYGAAPCTRAVPTVTLSPSNPSVAPGGSVQYTVSVRNNDAAACAPASFVLSSVQPSGWTAVFSLSMLTLAPGETGSAGLTQTVSPEAVPGTYAITVAATNGTYASTAGAYSTVVTVPQLSVAVSVSSAAFAPRDTVPIRAAVTLGGAPVAGATVTFSLLKPDGRRTAKTITTKSNGVAAWDYRIAAKDPPGSYSVSASAASGSNLAQSNSVTFSVR